MLYEYRYKNRKDFYICKLNIIKSAFKNCIKSIKNMEQTGGGSIYNKLNILKDKIRKIDKHIIKYNKLVE